MKVTSIFMCNTQPPPNRQSRLRSQGKMTNLCNGNCTILERSPPKLISRETEKLPSKVFCFAFFKSLGREFLSVFWAHLATQVGGNHINHDVPNTLRPSIKKVSLWYLHYIFFFVKVSFLSNITTVFWRLCELREKWSICMQIPYIHKSTVAYKQKKFVVRTLSSRFSPHHC